MIERLEQNNPKFVFVKLVEGEHEWLESLGRQRNQNGKALGWKSKTKDTSDKWNVSGISGEWAVSMLYNLPVGCITSKNAAWLNAVGDVGGFLEVRTSTGYKPSQWDLGSFRSALKDNRPYVHCLSFLWPEYIVVTGWVWGHEIRASKKVLAAAHHSPDDPIHWLTQAEIKDPLSLFEVIRRL